MEIIMFFLESIVNFFIKYPQILGDILCLIGIFHVIGAVLNWKWLLVPESSKITSEIALNSKKTDITSAKIFYIIFGIICIDLGVVIIFLFMK